MTFLNDQYYKLWQIVIFVENLLPEFDKSNTKRKIKEDLVPVAVTGFSKGCPIIALYEMIGRTTCLSTDIRYLYALCLYTYYTGLESSTRLGLAFFPKTFSELVAQECQRKCSLNFPILTN